MVNQKLIIEGTTVPLPDGISTELIYSIQDLEQPDKRKASFSRNFTLPESKELNEVFNFIFEVNSDSTFNPNNKADAIYFVDGVPTFRGYIQLTNIVKIDNSRIEYQVILVGELGNIFVEMGNEFVDDTNMNWDDFDHAFSLADFILTWDTSYIDNGVVTPYSSGSGYIYPLLRYGGNIEESKYDVYPAAFTKEYVDRIFAAAGYTYTSSFFTSRFFKKLIIPYSGKEFTSGYTNNENILVSVDTPQFVTAASSSITTTTGSTTESFSDTLTFSNVDTDPSTQYNTATGVLTATQSGVFKIDIELELQFNFQTGAANDALQINEFLFQMLLNKNAQQYDTLQCWSLEGDPIAPAGYTTSVVQSYPSENFLVPADGTQGPNGYNIYYDYNYSQRAYVYRLSAIVPMEAGDTLDTSILGVYSSISGRNRQGEPVNGLENFYDTTSTTYSSGDCTATIFSGTLRVENNYFNEWAGQTIDFKSSIPKNIKKRDFMKGLINMFNLFIETDPDNPKNLLIEPRNDYFNANIEDWSGKVDYTQPLKYKTLAAFNKGVYTFTYKKDSDFYNANYSQDWAGAIYGERKIYTENDFSQEEYKTEIVFSATPSIGGWSHNRITPIIAKGETNAQLKSTGGNIRILIYNGLKDSSTPFTITQGETGGESSNLSEYPFCGMWDDPRSPNQTIDFGAPREILYTSSYGPITWIDNDLFNKYHADEFTALTDKNAKMLECSVLLNPVDVGGLDFRKQYYLDGAYFRLYEVKYNPQNYKPSMCKFLKLPSTDIFTPTSTVIYGASYDKIVNGQFAPTYRPDVNTQKNITFNPTIKISGDGNNVNRSSNKINIVGNENKIEAGVNNVSVVNGNGNTILAGVSNVTLINTNNKTVNYSGSTYVDGQQIKGRGAILQVNKATPCNLNQRGYEVTPLTDGIDMSLPDAALYEGMYLTFKKVNTNALSFDIVPDASLGQTIDGYTSYKISKHNSMVSVYSNGTDWKIAL